MISVVIPLYNKASSISKTIASVLAQTYHDFEIVIVNDGSTDNGAEVVSKIIDDRIHLVTKINGGVSSARNEGIRQSRGKYVAFLDGDDFWAPNYLEELVELINEFPNAGIYGMGLAEMHNGDIQPETNKTFNRGYVNCPWTLTDRVWSGSSSTILKSVFEKVGYFDERMAYGEDLDMWWRVLLEFKGARYAKPLAFYEQESENRAMNRSMPFEKHLPFYIEKYEDYRRNNAEFRFFFDRECLYRVFQYATVRKYRKDLKRVLSHIDFSLQKKSMRLRFMFPRCYRLYMLLVGRI